MPTTPLHAGDPAQIGEFRLLGRIGSGGMGLVYLGESAAGVRAAVKVIRPELGDVPAFRARFRREVDAARQVRSPVTAAVVDADPEGSPPWVAFEYVDAPTLTALVSLGVPRPSVVMGVVAGVAEALVAIHEAGITHRDLKPSNVLVPPTGVKVIDFGIAAAVDATALTATGFGLGTPTWVSPEQARGETVTSATDIFAWGLLAVFTATGRHAFGATEMTPAALLYRVVHEQPDLSGVPSRLVPVIERALSKHPQSRSSAAQLVSALLPLDTEVMTAGAVDDATRLAAVSTASAATPQPWWQRLGTTVWVAAVLVVVVALVGGVAFALLSHGRGGPATASSPPTSALTTSTSTSTLASSAPLAPATSPPVVGECRQQLSFGADGTAGPVTCPNGDVNVLAWQYYAPGNPSVLALGPFATPADVTSAECSDMRASTIPIETDVVHLATAYYGWKFGVDPASTLLAGCSAANASTVSTASWPVYQDPATGFPIAYPPTWAARVNGAQTIFRDPSSGSYMLVEYRTPAGPSAIQAWQSQEQQFAAQHQGYQRVTLTGDDQTATWEYTYSDGTQTLHAVDYAFILGNGKYGFALNWQSPDTEWDALQATFTAMRSTFINPPGT